jgi:hypothetical protein
MGEWRYSSTNSHPQHCVEVSGQLHMLTALPLWKQALYTLNQRLGGPQGQSRCCGIEKSLPLIQIPTCQSCPAYSPITILTDLPWIINVLKIYAYSRSQGSRLPDCLHQDRGRVLVRDVPCCADLHTRSCLGRGCWPPTGYPANQCLSLRSAAHDSHLAINIFGHQREHHHVRMLQTHL